MHLQTLKHLATGLVALLIVALYDLADAVVVGVVVLALCLSVLGRSFGRSHWRARLS